MKQTISGLGPLHVTVAGQVTVHETVLNTVFSPCLAVYFWPNPPISRRTEAWTRLRVLPSGETWTAWPDLRPLHLTNSARRIVRRGRRAH